MKYFLYCRKSTESEERQVLSLESQREAIDRSFANRDEIEIVEAFVESKSAKTPGRPVFAAMIARIEAGEADGIVSWAPDRLARNSIDGGRIIYLLDTGALRDLKFATYTFENNSQGKFMLSIMFGQSKYYSDALSENVKRGNRTKLERGWRPNRAPLGYLNDALTRTIVPDPMLFPLIRRMFELVLSGAHNPREIGRLAREQWGLLTPRSKRSGGRPIGRATIYKLLANPFYKGQILWGGLIYPGRHDRVVSPEEFDRVQAILTRRDGARAGDLTFAFTGLLRCGSCGRMVTAERKTNRYGSNYTYYHCSARSLTRQACGERSVEAGKLNAQIREFLASLAISDEIAGWVRDELERTSTAYAAERDKQAQSRERAIAEISTQLGELTALRLRRLVDDDEFVERRAALERDRQTLTQAQNAPDPKTLIEPFELLVLISNKAVEWFDAANDDGKRAILKLTCSNPRLSCKVLSIEAAKPLFTTVQADPCLRQRRVVDQVRTPTAIGSEFLRRFTSLFGDCEVRARLDAVRQLQLRFELPAAARSQGAARAPGRGSPPRSLPRGSTARHERLRKRP